MVDQAIPSARPHLRRGNLWNALVAEGRVIAALVRRDAHLRNSGNRFGLVWAMVEPVVYAYLLTLLFNFVRQRVPPLGTSMEAFFITGLAPYLLFRNLARGVRKVGKTSTGVLHLPVVNNRDVLIARSIFEILIYIPALAVWILWLKLIGAQYLPSHPLIFLEAFGVAALLGLGFGSINLVMNEIVPGWATTSKWAFWVMLFTSGAIFPVDQRIPKHFLDIVWWNPLNHVVEWGRLGFYPFSRPQFLNVEYVLVVAFASLFLGLLLEKAFRRRLSVDN
jgi:capsular polysaccharide transport system permease protein